MRKILAVMSAAVVGSMGLLAGCEREVAAPAELEEREQGEGVFEGAEERTGFEEDEGVFQGETGLGEEGGVIEENTPGSHAPTYEDPVYDEPAYEEQQDREILE